MHRFPSETAEILNLTIRRYQSLLNVPAILERAGNPLISRIRPASKKLRILTFNTHEGYNYELAKTGHSFDVLLPPTRGLWKREWDVTSRPLPPNVRVIGGLPELYLDDLAGYDLILAQTLEQFALIEFHPTPKLLLLHTSVSVAGSEWPSLEAMYRINNLRNRLKNVPIVYVSDYCHHGWGWPGRVIDIGIDERDYARYQWTGRDKVVLTVSHFFQERAKDTGMQLHRRIVGDDIPFKIVGHNPQLPNSGPASSWDELRRNYQRHAVYLDCSGGSMAGLEAAAAGMPLVLIARPNERYTFTDGHDAYVSDDLGRLRTDVLRLLRNPDLARTMGKRAQRTVARVWSTRRFLTKWQDAFANAARNTYRGPPRVADPTGSDYYEGAITVEEIPSEVSPGELAWAKVRIRNAGSGVWSCYTNRVYAEVRLSFRWLTPAGEVVSGEGERTPLLADVRPGEETCLEAAFRGPKLAGAFLLEWDLVCELVSWFSARGMATARVPMTVRDRSR